MELEKFITGTLVGIITGVKEAQKFASDNKSIINPLMSDFNGVKLSKQHIEFDIALTVTNEQSSNIGGKIGIASFGAGANTSDKGTNETISRIKFNVPIILPYSNE